MKSDALSMYDRFVRIIKEILWESDYDFVSEDLTDPQAFDLIFGGMNNSRSYVEAKFFRSRYVPASLIKSMANRLAFKIKGKEQRGMAIVAVPCIVDKSVKNAIDNDLGIWVWDRSTIYHRLTEFSIELTDEFRQLLI